MSDCSEKILIQLEKSLEKKSHAILAIDGRCAAGKTTLAEQLQKKTGYSVIHMDHFFLRPEQRTSVRIQEPGGNIDYERFYEEVIIPLLRCQNFAYRPFNCHTQTFCDPVPVVFSPAVIIEGSYSCHPKFSTFYDITVFLSCSSEDQMRRIIERSDEIIAQRFQDLWIPLEERYFDFFKIKNQCDICFLT